MDMEEIEISSWLTLDAIKKKADIIETVGNLQTGHNMSIFCVIEDDYLELCYSDSGPNYLRRYEDKDELEEAIEQRKEEVGEAPYEEDMDFNEEFEEEEEEEEEEFDLEDDSDKF